MVLARSLEEWLEKCGARNTTPRFVPRALAEGRGDARARWIAWNNRRIAAQENNEPFDEPPPGLRVAKTSGVGPLSGQPESLRHVHSKALAGENHADKDGDGVHRPAGTHEHHR